MIQQHSVLCNSEYHALMNVKAASCQTDADVSVLFAAVCIYLLLLPPDLAAIPDFQSGAMENWGLTTYRETGLLYDPDRSSASDKLAIIKVIAHELAHQVT